MQDLFEWNFAKLFQNWVIILVIVYPQQIILFDFKSPLTKSVYSDA